MKDEKYWDDVLRKLLVISGILLIFISLLTITGYITGINYLIIFNEKYIPMPVANGFLFGISGLYFIFQRAVNENKLLRMSAILTFTLMLVFSFLKVLEFVPGTAVISEENLFPYSKMHGRFHLNRMSPYTGALFLISSMAIIILLVSHRKRKFMNAAALAGVLISATGFISEVGYLYDTPFLYTGNIVPLASRTSLSFMLAGFGIMFAAGKDTLVLKHLTRSSPYSKMLRIFIPFLILLFLIQGVFDIILIHHFRLNEAIDLTIFTVLSIITVIPVIIKVASTIFSEATIAERERQKANEDLKKALDIQRLILENNPMGICLVRDDTIEFSNSSFQSLFNNSGKRQEIKSFSALFQESDRKKITAAWKSVLRKGMTYDTAVDLYNNGSMWVRIIGQAIDPDDAGKGTIWLIEDITERKKQREMMRLLSHTVSSLSECISITDKKDRIIFVNKAFEKTYGFSQEELFGKAISVVRSDSVSIGIGTSILPSTAEGGWSGELLNRKKNGDEFPVYLSTSKVVDEKNETIAYVGIATDITDIKEAQKREQDYIRKLKESNDAKDKLFSIISHDLRSPFSSIIGFLRLLNEQYDSMSDKEKKSYLHDLGDSAENTFGLIENLLTWSRTQRGGIKPAPVSFNLYEIIEELTGVLNSVAEKKEIKFCNKVSKDFTIYADRDMIKTVILNLINNAVKFTGKGGMISVCAVVTGNFSEITVSDTGIGIPPERLEKMFSLDNSVSTPGTFNEKGTGLGLIISKEFVEKNGGTIRVDSEPGKGSRFTFSVPLSAHSA